MKKFITTSICLLLLYSFSWAQTKINGKVTTENNEPLSGVSVMVKGDRQGAITGEDGSFTIAVPRLPVTLIFTFIGFEEKQLEVTTDSLVAVQLNESSTLGNVVVVSATRVPTRLMEAPVSIERVGLQAIRTAPATSYYDILANTKGVDFATSGLLFKTPTTRGFGGSGNARFNQLMDGMDNQLPGLNFAVGSFIGLTELDVESMELLPGASSALYGPGGMNGTLLVNSKNPFQHQGLSVLGRQGVMHVDKRQRPDASLFTDWSLRYAKAFNRFAFKVSAQYVHAKDWQATDSSNFLRLGSAGKVIPGNRQTDPNYDGVNVYGDETNTGGAKLNGIANAIQSAFPAALIQAFNNVPVGAPFTSYQQVINQLDAAARPFAQQLAPFHYGLRNNFFPNQEISRTGYPETSVLDPTTKNLKLSGALHYKLTGNTEASLSGHWGTGTTVYTGSDRYAFKNVKIGQYKLEFRNPAWFARVYTTQENAGDSYAATVAMRRLNEVWKPSYNPANPAGSWYPQYTAAYIQAVLTGAQPSAAHNIARSFADQGRPAAGSDQFNQIVDNINKVAISKGGSLFIDKSDLWVVEGQYNFSKHIDFAEVIVGANVKRYNLNSSGTIFIDSTGPIPINEFGTYIQATKRLFDERLILTASGRFDKNENFKSKLTPRFAAVVKVAENNNIRLSYQTAYRFPTTQGQFIRLEVGQNQAILGGLPWIVEYMNLKQYPAVLIENGAPNPNKPYQYKTFKPETSRSFEVGYKSLIQNKVLIDVYGYVSSYVDFLGRQLLYQPGTGYVYSIVTNSENIVKMHGYGASLTYRLPLNFAATANFFSDRISDVPQDIESGYNTPKYRFTASFSNSGLSKSERWGFGVQFRWQDAFLFENDFAQGAIPAFSTVDAQVSYKVLKDKSVIRIGATNLLNNYYKNAFGSPEIGGLYYVSLGYNLFK